MRVYGQLIAITTPSLPANKVYIHRV